MNQRILWIALIAAGAAAAAPGGKIGRDIDTESERKIDVIVQFANVPSEADKQAVKQKGGDLKSQLAGTKSAVYEIRGKAAKDVASLPGVTYISPNRELRGQLDYSASAVNATLAWSYGFTGKNIGIAVIDSGISPSADFNSLKSSRVVYAESFLALNGVPGAARKDADPNDYYGHGTHVAGIAAGDGSASKGKLSGIAPGANLINLRVLDDQGVGTDAAVIAAIGRAIQLKEQYNIRVINLSLGRAVFESYLQDPLCQAVEAAWKAGIVVVAAAGNNGRDNTAGIQGYTTINAPGNDPFVITVGAMKSMATYSRGDDLIASYSSKGPTAIDHIVKPDLVAPGNLVVSTVGTGTHSLIQMYPRNVVAGTYFRLSGTSMAAPVVAGAAALLLEKNPALTPDQLKARLMKTASKTFPAASIATDPDTGITYRSVYDAFTVGAGYLDITAALSNTDLADRLALSPAVVYDPQTGKLTLVGDDSAIWGSRYSAVWGDTTVWGSRYSAVWGDSAIWGSSVVWGDSAVWGSSAVWGNQTMSGFSAVWGTSAVWGSGSGITGERIAISGEN